MVASSLSNQRSSGMGAKRIHCADVPSQIGESGGKPVYVEVIDGVDQSALAYTFVWEHNRWCNFVRMLSRFVLLLIVS